MFGMRSAAHCYAIFLQILFYHFDSILCDKSVDNFYDLLEVSSDANTRTIRQAFKKIALVKHPDKNLVNFILLLVLNQTKPSI
jgi:preprotein translocase subunit Sec63